MVLGATLDFLGVFELSGGPGGSSGVVGGELVKSGESFFAENRLGYDRFS